MQIVPREMKEKDYEAVASIFRDVHNLHQSNRPDIYRKTDDPLSLDYFTEICADPKGIALCAVCGEQIVGVSYTYLKEPSVNPLVLPRVTAFMDDLAVHPAFRGCGIGKMLLEETRRIAAERGAVSLELMVWAFNENAIEFYEHAGMRPRSVIMEMSLIGE